jgi:hypothetical protein
MKKQTWLDHDSVKNVTPAVIKGAPKYVSADTGFGMQVGHDADSQFIAAELKGEDGREFGIMLHMMCMNTNRTVQSAYPMAMSILSMTDLTHHTYCYREDSYSMPDFSQSTNEMNVVTPVSCIKGDKNHVIAWAELPDGRGRIKLDMEHKGPVLDKVKYISQIQFHKK